MAIIACGALFFGSCADHYDGDESWSSPVRNATLESPAAGDIEVNQDKVNGKITISWPVVYGAGGYDYVLLNVSDPEAPDTLKSGWLDGCSLTFDREEEVNYSFSICTKGNDDLNNKGAEKPTVKTFSSFERASFPPIPVGDLFEYFTQNPISTDSIGKEMIFDLEPGGQYTISNILDFGSQQVTLRSTSKTKHAIITMSSENGCIRTSAPMTLKYLDFDYAQSKQPAIALSKEPADSLKGLLGTQTTYYNIMGAPIFISSCNFRNLRDKFFFDNNVAKYCVETLTIDNVTAQFNIPSQLANHAFIYLQSGFVKDLTIRNTTMWNTSDTNDNNLQYFVRYENAGRLDRAGYSRETQTQSVSFINCTFYRMGYDKWANYDGFKGQKYTVINVQNNIWLDCCPSGGGIARRICGGSAASSYNSISFNNNTYWNAGKSEITPETSQNYDLGKVLQTDPAFVDVDNGNFMPTGSDQVDFQTGDPRWFDDGK